jgi:hypothetical protein
MTSTALRPALALTVVALLQPRASAGRPLPPWPYVRTSGKLPGIAWFGANETGFEVGAALDTAALDTAAASGLAVGAAHTTVVDIIHRMVRQQMSSTARRSEFDPSFELALCENAFEFMT